MARSLHIDAVVLFRDTPSDRQRHEREQANFEPFECPRADCPSHASGKFKCIKWGWHETERAPFRVQRFRCKACKHTFSTQTFHHSYYQKRPELDQRIFHASHSCSGNRQIGTIVGCGKSTVAEKITRLARHGLRFHAFHLAKAARFGGDVLFDGLGSFEHSQYHPFWLNVGVHRDTAFVFGFTESALRRSGTMRPEQKRKRARLEAELGCPPRKSIRIGTADLLLALKPYLNLEATRLVTDEHKAYPHAIRDAGLQSLPHFTIPGSAQRTSRNPLFEINLVDMKIRHGQSSQKRETIAFNKRRQAGIERAVLWMIWKNYMAAKRVKGRHPTPAELAGIFDKPLTFDDIFSRRLLPWNVDLPPAWARQVARTIVTPVIGRNREHRAKFCS